MIVFWNFFLNLDLIFILLRLYLPGRVLPSFYVSSCSLGVFFRAAWLITLSLCDSHTSDLYILLSAVSPFIYESNVSIYNLANIPVYRSQIHIFMSHINSKYVMETLSSHINRTMWPHILFLCIVFSMFLSYDFL